MLNGLQFLPALLICLQLIVPPGTMPTSVDGGWPLSLCPDQFGVIYTNAGSNHHHHHGHHASSEAPAEDARSLTNCAFAVLGTDLYADVAPAFETLSLAVAVQTFWRLERSSPLARRYAQPVRGPPQFLRMI